jgi:uncharacterized membrane-anchored protein
VGRTLVALSLSLVVVLFSAANGAQAQAQQPGAQAQSEPERVLRSISWTEGPANADIGSHARIELPPATRFTAGDGTRKVLELLHNPTDGSELGLLTPDDLDWFLTFEFSDIGYVKDADKEKLDADAILESIRDGNEEANEARKQRGWAPITVVGWHTPPFYNKETHNLEWCIKGESEGRPIINYNTRILGRGGVMSANLMVAPDRLDATLPAVKKILAGFSYQEGKRYAEWRSGDKIAKYGLTALVVGGAVGLAAKAGLLAKLGKLWKPIILGLIALAAALKGFIARLLGSRSRQAAPPPPDAPAPPPQQG